MSAAAPSGIVDREALVAPISEESPSGENLQYSGLHDEIREARRAEEDLAQGEWKRELKVADWRTVKDLASEATATRTKDLRVLAWLGEALVKLHGFAGLAEALWVTRSILEPFWETLYPEIDEGDLEARANALAFFDRQVSQYVKEVPLTVEVGGVSYTFHDYEESLKFDFPEDMTYLQMEERDRLVQKKAQAEAEGRVTGEMWRTARNVGRRAFYEDLWAVLSACREEFRALDDTMDRMFGRETPGLSALKKSLDEISFLIENVLKEKRAAEPDAVVEEPAVEEVVGADGEVVLVPVAGAARGPVRSREEAVARLEEIAEFFRKTEPHSPVSYLVQRAVRWANMPLDAWLQTVVRDYTVLESLKETLGLKDEHES